MRHAPCLQRLRPSCIPETVSEMRERRGCAERGQQAQESRFPGAIHHQALGAFTRPGANRRASQRRLQRRVRAMPARLSGGQCKARENQALPAFAALVLDGITRDESFQKDESR
ncbi:hypothetical protein NDU88_000989 [Pleurodeles waltl]|uniref:Uncharacterized protein n=1 Tax=Pleurodeles waltl TaxID=8319 RepID=A0AAV7NEF3_PLEWA|nr:hypothetical protein NDU88_000989 [Pleurodeles waltl]